MAYNKRRASAAKQKTPVSVVSFVTGGVSIICLLVLIVCFVYLLHNELEPSKTVVGVLFINLIVSMISAVFSLGELRKQGFDFVTRIICFVFSVLPVVAYVILYVLGFMI